ncbi:site-2 protease family protein [Candidatus Saccharibacteria bacterium]|nr:site-2 protease family protein [Candidatus Saccharibacteria bacterium]
MPLALLVFGLLMFVALVVVHEWGHYIAARRNGIEVEEFGIGFPPKAKTITKRHGTEFTLNWLPLGGFVKLKGEHDADTEPGTYGAARLPAKVKVMLAGVGMNLLVAFVLLTILAVTGMPKIIDNQFTVSSDTQIISQDVLVGAVADDSPAAKAGLEQDDELVSVGAPGQTPVVVVSSSEFPGVTRQFAGQTVEVMYVRDGEQRVASATLESAAAVEASRSTDDPKGYLGIIPSDYVIQRSTWSAPVVAVGFIGQATVQTLDGLGSALGNLFTGNAAKAGEQVSGPVGIFGVLKRGSELGLGFVLMIIALISLTLAIMNALPIPALDGGRLFVTLLYRALRKPLTPKAEERIHGTGFALLMILFLVITIVDVKRL